MEIKTYLGICPASTNLDLAQPPELNKYRPAVDIFGARTLAGTRSLEKQTTNARSQLEDDGSSWISRAIRTLQRYASRALILRQEQVQQISVDARASQKVRTILVTLSGTHGSGKSTNAGKVYYLLNSSGKKFSYIRHQDLLDPFGFIVRRAARVLHVDPLWLDKTAPVRVLWSVYFLLIYLPILAGGIRIRQAFGYSVVTDRYVYDLIVGSWGNHTRLPLEQLLIWLLPRPDVSFVFEAETSRILRDRPEHSAEFIINEKLLYNKLADHFGLRRVSTSESRQEVWNKVATEIQSKFDKSSSNSSRNSS